MLEQIPYALAIAAAAAAAWDYGRRRLAVHTRQLEVEGKFLELARNFELLDVKVKKAIEHTFSEVNEKVSKMQATLAVEAMKRDNAGASRRIG